MSELKILSWAELSELSDKELLDLLDKYNAAAIIQKNIEQAIKILINSLYGYLGSIYSRFYNRYLAEGITLNGQTHIRDSERAINNYLEKITGIKKDRVLAVDTDSILYDTIIRVNGREITIGEYYDSCNSTLINDGKETKYINGIDLALAYDGDKVVENRIVYVMRHKVKKKLYKISIKGTSVTVTEDHSVMVIDLDGNLIKIKPIDMNPKLHKIIKIIEK